VEYDYTGLQEGEVAMMMCCVFYDVTYIICEKMEKTDKHMIDVYRMAHGRV
jgi:hypothetical protein